MQSPVPSVTPVMQPPDLQEGVGVVVVVVLVVVVAAVVVPPAVQYEQEYPQIT